MLNSCYFFYKKYYIEKKLFFFVENYLTCDKAGIK